MDRLEPRIRILLGSSIAIGPGKAALLQTIKRALGRKFIDWLVSPAGQQAIADTRSTASSCSSHADSRRPGA
jgi:ABC-type Fe3+ transport system substrate-binding protein